LGLILAVSELLHQCFFSFSDWLRLSTYFYSCPTTISSAKIDTSYVRMTYVSDTLTESSKKEKTKMQNRIRASRISDLQLKADKFEFSVFSWSEKIGRAIMRSMPEGMDMRPSLRKVLKRMRWPEQGNFHKLIDLISDEMTLIHGPAWIKSALVAIRPYKKDSDHEMPSVELMQIHDALDNWTLNVLMFLRASGLVMRHRVSHLDTDLRRRRLAAVLQVFRNHNCNKYRRKAAKIYSNRRYQPVVMATSNAGRKNMFMDPTVSVSFTSHRRVAKPMAIPSFTFGTPSSEQVREANYVRDYRSFKKSITSMRHEEQQGKMDFWLTARGLKNRPRMFTYASQVRSWDELVHDYENQESFSDSRVITTGRFLETGRVHPLATHWRRPLGSREWASWHRWWKR